MSHYYAKFKENPWVGTNASTPFSILKIFSFLPYIFYMYFQIQLALKTSAGKQTLVTSFSTEYHLCDREWHKLRASFINSVIRLQVDGKEWETTTSGEITASTAAVIIGGLPGKSYGNCHSQAF